MAAAQIRKRRGALMSRAHLVIDLEALRGNARAIRSHVAPCEVMAVLKADAYGLGALAVAEALLGAGIDRLGVADVVEARQLAGLGLPVHILGSLLPGEVAGAVALDVVCPVTDLACAEAISGEGVRQGRTVKADFLIDTGMGRLGIPVAEAADVIRRCLELPAIDFQGIYSHFPVAYRGGGAYTQRQLEVFRALVDGIADLEPTRIHMANSDAVNNVPDAIRLPFNVVRTGINLYGAYDMEGGRTMALSGVLTMRTVLVAARLLPAGSAIGYGCTHRLACDTRVGTIPVGYADGLPLALSNRGYVLIHGQVCPVLGRVSMDYTTVDLSQVPQAQAGDEVVCLGGDGPTAISVEDWAQLKGTHPYDIICSIGKRVERIYE